VPHHASKIVIYPNCSNFSAAPLSRLLIQWQLGIGRYFCLHSVPVISDDRLMRQLLGADQTGSCQQGINPHTQWVRQNRLVPSPRGSTSDSQTLDSPDFEHFSGISHFLPVIVHKLTIQICHWLLLSLIMFSLLLNKNHLSGPYKTWRKKIWENREQFELKQGSVIPIF